MHKILERRKFEADFTTNVSKWLKYYAKDLVSEFKCKNFGPVEVKVSYDKRFNFNSGFKKGQLEILAQAKRGTVVYKISDIARINARPWDLDCYTKSKSAVAIMWLHWGNREFYLLDPELLLDMIARGEKSISEEDAKELAFKIGYLKG